jgi:hypothetical protein
LRSQNGDLIVGKDVTEHNTDTQQARSDTKDMAKFNFEREVRTPFSECYTVLDNEDTVGRLDIHFADAIVHATLTVEESLTSDSIQDLIDAIDEELLDAVGILREEIIIHIHQGRELGVYNPPDFEGTNGGGLRLN